MFFPEAGIELNPLIPVLIGLVVALVCGLGGLSGAFLILPVQVNYLGFHGLAVSPTNFLFNVVAAPFGVYRFQRDGRMCWLLGLIILLGSLPGILLGTALRSSSWLSELANFQLFVGLVLAALALWLLYSMVSQPKTPDFRLCLAGHSLERQKLVGFYLEMSFAGQTYRLSLFKLVFVSLFIGLLGGAYGIGGGAIIAPVLVSVFRLPVYLAGGPSLLATFVSSLFGLFSYSHLWPWISGAQPVFPDWFLGLLLGLGGALGVYLGSSLQKYISARALQLLLFLLISGLSIKNML